MPYHIIKKSNGYFVANKLTGRVYSKNPLSYNTALKQMRAIIISENKHNKGGLVNVIEYPKFLETKESYEYPEKMQKLVNFLKFSLKYGINYSSLYTFGSYNLRIQPYYADFDNSNIVNVDANRKETIPIIVKSFQDTVKKIENKKGWFFTDAKAGTYEDGEAVHWRSSEIMKGKRDGIKPDFNDHVGNKLLYDAVQEHALLKIDMVAPYYNKYIEITCVYLVTDKDGYFNYGKDYLGINRVLTSLIDDLIKQLKKGKYFKVIKRLFALLRQSAFHGMTNAKKYLSYLSPIIGSNISKLSTIGSDLSTLELLIQLDKPINTSFVGQELNLMKEQISNILDLKINEKDFDSYLDILYFHIKNDDKDKSLQVLELLTNEISEINKNELNEYFKSKGTTFINYVNMVIRDVSYFLRGLAN